MSINSYAQNFEDVMLWRALGHIRSGTYIDVGAQDPVVDSVSLAFHEHGWHGIHVEPTPRYAELLRQQRPGDTVIQAAVGTRPGVLRFFEIPDTGISTADATIAAQHRERGFDVRETTVPCIALSAIFDTCTAPDIHWLKVDVEGFEQQVLSSWRSSAVRPWVVVVESTLPLTQIETRENWEATLVAYGYAHVYFDGLNRYYVSNEHPELREAFAAPPNVFDQFTLNGTASATFHKKIDERYQEKVAEASALVKQQRQLTSSEIERLTLGIALLEKTQAERERAAAVQMLEIQQKTADDKAEQVRSHGEQQHALVSQHSEREQSLSQQLQARQQDLQNLLKDRAKREQDVGTQLLAGQLQAARDTTDQARMHREQVKTLRRQHAEREEAHAQQLQAGQQEIRRLEQERAQREKEHAVQSSQSRLALENRLGQQLQREQEVIAQLLAVQQQAEHQKAEQAKLHSERVRALSLKQAEREQCLLEQQRSAHEERLQQDQSWARRDKALGQEIAALQSEVQALHHAHQLQAQHHDLQLGARLAEHSRLIETCAAVESQLKAEILSGQQQALLLHQSLAELQQTLAATHASLIWRMTKPLRALLPFTGLKNPGADAVIAPAAALPLPLANARQAPVKPNLLTTTATVDSSAQAHASEEGALPPDSASPINALYAFNEPLMPSSAHTPTAFTSTPANTLDELLACHDQQFVICAYQTLFGRAPDPEGLTYYLDRLRSGFSKIQMLAQLRLSTEGKSRVTTLPKLDGAIRQHQRGQYPLIGWLFRQFDNTGGGESIQRKLRAIENQILVLNEASNCRFNQMETAFAGLHHLIRNQSQTVISILGGTSPATPDSAAHASVQPTALDGLKQLSPHARDVYLQLKTAAVQHAEKAH
ncbi:FkbM family methyltransferase [Polaromonas sp.]|uniref:FkbM family methyltransferase n=1 Tax=Polaromonas sp. TaxID=1869339 RepID=UPI0017F41A0B|nr:FkbM family methyltransferase [Polaromonas sp.]NMM04860.1 FkbM family methyltransferase [Polaromonas sp.]